MKFATKQITLQQTAIKNRTQLCDLRPVHIKAVLGYEPFNTKMPFEFRSTETF